MIDSLNCSFIVVSSTRQPNLEFSFFLVTSLPIFPAVSSYSLLHAYQFGDINSLTDLTIWSKFSASQQTYIERVWLFKKWQLQSTGISNSLRKQACLRINKIKVQGSSKYKLWVTFIWDLRTNNKIKGWSNMFWHLRDSANVLGKRWMKNVPNKSVAQLYMT